MSLNARERGNFWINVSLTARLGRAHLSGCSTPSRWHPHCRQNSAKPRRAVHECLRFDSRTNRHSGRLLAFELLRRMGGSAESNGTGGRRGKRSKRTQSLNVQ